MILFSVKGRSIFFFTSWILPQGLILTRNTEYAKPMEFTKSELYALLNRQGPLWLVEADLSQACLEKIDLTEAKLTRADLTGASLPGAKMERADLVGAKLTGANLSFAKLSGAILDDADLSGADLTEARLDRAELYGAKLTGAILDDIYIYGANYDKKTKWPKGFDPLTRGAIFQE
jgi:uncharacterized protein YjbI with pentapeptide repeats